MSARSRFKAILLAGLIVGSADILLAFLSAYLRAGVTPDRVLRFIASGVFGGDAFSGGAGMAAWGLLFHFFIAFSWTALFFYLYPRLKLSSINPWLTGALYGLFIWLVMNLLVVPLSRTPSQPITLTGALIGAVILIVAIGWPLTGLAGRYYGRELKVSA